MGKRQCTLHIGCKTTKEEIKLFDEKTWLNICKVKHAHLNKSNASSSKYFDLCKCLPDNRQETYGYHSTCYSNFTSISMTTHGAPDNDYGDSAVEKVTSDAYKAILRSQIEPFLKPASTSKRKRCGSKTELVGHCETTEAALKIKATAEKINDFKLLAKISDVSFCAKEIKYHHTCRKEYLNKVQSSKSTSEKAEKQYAHDKAFRAIVDYVSDVVINAFCPKTLKFVFEKYIAILEEAHVDVSGYKPFMLEEKLLGKFGRKLVSSKKSKKEGKILHAINLTKEEAFANLFKMTSLKTAALDLRNIALQLSTNHLVYPLTADSLAKGEAVIPDEIMYFLRVLLTGEENDDRIGDRPKRLIKSLASDLIYSISNDQIKPAKQLLLGMAMKRMTGSKKIIEMLNRFGQSVSYHIIEELETDLAQAINEKQRVCPDGIALDPNLVTCTTYLVLGASMTLFEFAFKTSQQIRKKRSLMSKAKTKGQIIPRWKGREREP